MHAHWLFYRKQQKLLKSAKKNQSLCDLCECIKWIRRGQNKRRRKIINEKITREKNMCVSQRIACHVLYYMRSVVCFTAFWMHSIRLLFHYTQYHLFVTRVCVFAEKKDSSNRRNWYFGRCCCCCCCSRCYPFWDEIRHGTGRDCGRFYFMRVDLFTMKWTRKCDDNMTFMTGCKVNARLFSDKSCGMCA